jgi:YD repeat-containing protein
MKKTLLKSLSLLIATSVFLTNCSKNDDPKKLSCLPTSLADEDGEIVNIVYDANGLIKENNRQEVGTTDNYKSLYTYNSDGKVTLIEEFRNDVKEAYHEITYSNSLIVHSYYSKVSDTFEKQSFERYYLTNGRITASTNHDMYNDFITEDSTVMEYDSRENIVKVTEYYQGVLDDIIDLQFDDKINPFHLITYSIGDDELFTLFTLSVNNAVKATIKSYDNGNVVDTDTETIVYTYDSNGYPKTIDYGDGPGSITYQCK